MKYPTPQNSALLKNLDRIAVGLTIVILFVVGMMRRVKIQTDIDFGFLPPLHALVNTGAAMALIVAFYYAKKREFRKHQNSIYVALIFSALFLLSYVTYHFTTEETTFCKEGMIRYVYFFFLITHVVLAGLSLPFILLALNRAITGHYERHRSMVKWVYPLWLYVAVTGPICYLLLRPCY